MAKRSPAPCGARDHLVADAIARWALARATDSRPALTRRGTCTRRGTRAVSRHQLTGTPSLELENLSTRQLLALWAESLRELRDRGVVRTFNNPIGDIAEALVASHFGGERGSFSQKTWDVKRRQSCCR